MQVGRETLDDHSRSFPMATLSLQPISRDFVLSDELRDFLLDDEVVHNVALSAVFNVASGAATMIYGAALYRGPALVGFAVYNDQHGTGFFPIAISPSVDARIHAARTG